MPEAITGSWFPSGFHGHFRSHIRNDICQGYRMEAKPPPPKVFSKRIKAAENELPRKRKTKKFKRQRKEVLSSPSAAGKHGYGADFTALNIREEKQGNIQLSRREIEAVFSLLSNTRALLKSEETTSIAQKIKFAWKVEYRLLRNGSADFSQEQPTKHIFSRHDNRHIFPSSVFSFENGLGKKKLLMHRESYNFTHWTPLEEELKRQRPFISTYRTDFWRKDDEAGRIVPQILVPRLARATTASCSGLTTYRQMLKSHGNLQASQNSTTMDITLISNNRAGGTGPSLQRSMSAPYKRLTVSDCLVWRTPDSIKKESNQTTEAL